LADELEGGQEAAEEVGCEVREATEESPKRQFDEEVESRRPGELEESGHDLSHERGVEALLQHFEKTAQRNKQLLQEATEKLEWKEQKEDCGVEATLKQEEPEKDKEERLLDHKKSMDSDEVAKKLTPAITTRRSARKADLPFASDAKGPKTEAMDLAERFEAASLREGSAGSDQSAEPLLPTPLRRSSRLQKQWQHEP
jgi:hypothetical protein